MNVPHDCRAIILLLLFLWRLWLLPIIYAEISGVADGNSNRNNNEIDHNAIGSGRTQLVACQLETGMWGDVDPNIFYMCDQHTQTAQRMRCPEGRGFFKGLGYYGCIPYAEWPACLASASDTPLHNCNDDDGEQSLLTWQHVDPNKFYMCEPHRPEPVLVNCGTGRGYVSAWVGASEIVGCAVWEKWRSYMQCQQYY